MTLRELELRFLEDEQAALVDRTYRHADAAFYGSPEPAWRVEMDWHEQPDDHPGQVVAVARTLPAALYEARLRWNNHPDRALCTEPWIRRTPIVAVLGGPVE